MMKTVCSEKNSLFKEMFAQAVTPPIPNAPPTIKHDRIKALLLMPQ